MSHLEYCACSHPLDHIGKPCRYPVPRQVSKEDRALGVIADDGPCPCPSGIRVDLAAYQLLADQNDILTDLARLMIEQSQSLARILAVLEESSGLKSRLVDAGNGRAKVEVKPKIVVVGG